MVKLCASGYPEFLGKDPSDEGVEWDETGHIQPFVVMMARRAGYLIYGGMEQGARSLGAGARAKANGMTKGWPDTTWILFGGKVGWIEYKLWGGVVSPEQKGIHEAMRERGHNVTVIWAKSPVNAWSQSLEWIRTVA